MELTRFLASLLWAFFDRGKVHKHEQSYFRARTIISFKIEVEESLITIIIINPGHIPQQNIIRRRPAMIPNPLALDAEEDPYPPPQHLEDLHGENPPLKIIKVVQMHAEFQTPRTPQQGIHGDSGVVEFLGVEPAVSAETPRVFWVIAFAGAREERQVPVLGYVPVETIS